jgi:hypothetical protein
VMRLFPVALAAMALFAAGCGDDNGGGRNGGGGEARDSASGGGDSGESESGGAEDDASGGGGSDEDAVRQTILDYADALAEGDAAGACATLSDEAKRELAQLYKDGDCEEAFGKLLPALPKSEVDKARNVDASEIRVQLDGDRATATGPAFERPAPMIKTDGQWKIASFSS